MLGGILESGVLHDFLFGDIMKHVDKNCLDSINRYITARTSGLSPAERIGTVDELVYVQAYRAHVILAFMVVPTLLEIITIPSMAAKFPAECRALALQNLVRCSSSLAGHLLFGDYVMHVVCTSGYDFVKHRTLSKWLKAGGFPSLVVSAVRGSVLCREVRRCDSCFPLQMYLGQTEKITDMVDHISDDDWVYTHSDEIITNLLQLFVHYFDDMWRREACYPGDRKSVLALKASRYQRQEHGLLIHTLHSMFRHSGVQFFEDGSRMAMNSTFFPYMTKHLSSKPHKYLASLPNFFVLHESHVRRGLSEGIEHRYRALLYEPKQLLGLPQEGQMEERIGCMFPYCPKGPTYIRLCAVYLMSILNPARRDMISKENEVFLEEYSRNLKLCGGYA